MEKIALWTGVLVRTDGDSRVGDVQDCKVAILGILISGPVWVTNVGVRDRVRVEVGGEGNVVSPDYAGKGCVVGCSYTLFSVQHAKGDRRGALRWRKSGLGSGGIPKRKAREKAKG
jgi:hypothetical protein